MPRLDRALADEQIAFLLMTQKAIAGRGGVCVRGKVNTYAPADCEYSDRHGLDKNQNAITDYIKDAID